MRQGIWGPAMGILIIALGIILPQTAHTPVMPVGQDLQLALPVVVPAVTPLAVKQLNPNPPVDKIRRNTPQSSSNSRPPKQR